jgi:hypothetical protein
VEYLEEKMIQGGHEEEMVIDTVYQLEQMLSDLSMMEVTESYITRELEEIKNNFGEDGSEGFYGGMIYDSIGRAQKLFHYRARAQSMLDRLATFTKKGNKKKYHVVEGGMAEYD